MKNLKTAVVVGVLAVVLVYLLTQIQYLDVTPDYIKRMRYGNQIIVFISAAISYLIVKRYLK
jgi:hypothetical protein